jgi:hypothetical protein
MKNNFIKLLTVFLLEISNEDRKQYVQFSCLFTELNRTISEAISKAVM